MKMALNDDNLKFMCRCPDCGEYTTRMTVTHPWRLYCKKCKQELQNPSHPKYYPTGIEE
jgi:ribosomal protein L37AE/L43A